MTRPIEVRIHIDVSAYIAAMRAVSNSVGTIKRRKDEQ